jgi:hypothetical protein
MKTNFTLGLASLVFLVLLSCHKEDDILPKNARLKQVLLYDSLKAKEPTRIWEEYEYNKLGLISKVSYFYYDNKFLKYDLYEYNSIGQLIKITDYNANSNSPTGYILLKTYTYTYSDEGKKIKETIGDNGREYNLFFYTDGRLSRIENYGYYEKPDVLLKYRIFELDNYGQPIREVLYGFNNEPFEWTINTFLNGLMVKTEIYIDKNLENNRRKIYRTFDANKNLKIQETYEGPYSSGVGHTICKYIYFGE